MIGYGESFGIDVKYSPVKYDSLSTGSADSALRMLEYWDITEHALVFPTDSMIDFDLAPMLDAHLRSGAVATIAAMTREPDEVAEKYGVMLVADDGRSPTSSRNPPSPSSRALPRRDRRGLPALALMTNAGFYSSTRP
jgi:NDP-sugar pyrophosphorylase family protein